MKLNYLSTLLSLTLFMSPLAAIEYTLKPGDVISIKSSSGKTTYHFNSDGKKTHFIHQGDDSQNMQKRIHKCDRLVLAHQDAGLSRHHPEQYYEIEKLLEVSKKHKISQYKKEAETSIIEVEKRLKTIENHYPDQNFSSIRNCFNLTRWEQCI